MRALYGDRYEAYSAGTHPTKVGPHAVKVMEEVRIDLSTQRSKGLDELGHMEFDYLVTVCNHAEESCPHFAGAGKRLHKGFKDPWDFRGTEEEILDRFRTLRDEIRAWIERTFGHESGN